MSRTSLNLLVWGCGYDSDLWRLLNTSGRTVFVETNLEWADKTRRSRCEVIPSPPPIRDPAGSPFRLESPDPQVPAPGHSFIQDPLPPALPAPPSLQPGAME